jgi:hypothetical protein
MAEVQTPPVVVIPPLDMEESAEAKTPTVSVAMDVDGSNGNHEQQQFDDKAKLAAVLLLQRRIFQLQAEKLAQLMKNNSPVSSSASSSTKKITLPATLVNRVTNTEAGRLMDDVEMAIMGTLNSEGKITFNCQVEELIVIMTRVNKVSLPSSSRSS